MDYSMPGFPVHQQLPELTQTRVHRVSDAIQPSYPWSYPSPPTFNLISQQLVWVGKKMKKKKKKKRESVLWPKPQDPQVEFQSDECGKEFITEDR